MRIRRVIGTLLICLTLSLFFTQTIVSNESDFRNISFDDKGYLLNYEIAQGDNLNEMFSNLGFDFTGTLTGSEFQVLLKNRKTEFQEVYYIESDSFILTQVPVYIFENFIILRNSLEAEIDTGSEFLQQTIGFNFIPAQPEIINAKLPTGSTIYLPNIFTNITRPNFGSMLKESNFFDFLPIIMSNNFDRYEAEFTALLLDDSISVNVFNQEEEFTVSLDVVLETAVSMKATWDKNTGLLLSLSIHLIYEEKSSVFIISLKDHEEILSPLESTQMFFFITNSYGNHELYIHHNSTEDQLQEWDFWLNQLNQTYGIRYLFSKSGLEFRDIMLVYNELYGGYFSSSPIHSSIVALLPPVLIPTWDKHIGAVTLARSLWDQLEIKLNGYQFYFSSVNTALFTINSVDFQLEYHFHENMHQIIWEGSLDYLSNTTLTVEPGYYIQEVGVNMSGWLAFTEEGLLNSFSFGFQELYLSYTTTQEPIEGNNYFYEYYLESVSENTTKPEFTEIEETSFSIIIAQIVFYYILVYLITKKKRRGNRYEI